MNRTVFIIDGFNLYHSTRDASNDLGGQSTKWLDVRALCESYLYTISKTARLEDVFYFSALATHLEAADPGKVQRHKTFIRCLKDTGVKVEMARFKRTPDYRCFHCGHTRCGHCGNRLKQWEEKETDVAIAAKLLELVFTNACDTVVLVTGDTDFTPAVRTAQSASPKKDVRFAFPYNRPNNDLRKLAPKSFRIGKERYVKCQFPDPYVTSSGKEIAKPSSW